MDPRKHDESLGQFQQLTEQFMTYTSTSQQLSPPRQASRKIATANKPQKPKLKIINENDEHEGLSPLLNAGKKQRKNVSVNSKVIAIGDAIFRSNFQSGNIQSVQKTFPATYQITLTKQLNSQRISAWFFFAVEGLKGQTKFTIKGFTKRSSLYNEGMKICYRQAQEGKWRRGGTKITYTQSYNQCDQARPTYQLHFSYFFKSNFPNCVQFAYCFPYTYGNLIKFLSLSQDKMTLQSLGKTYEGRQIPFVTIGNNSSNQVIIITARAHPGETVGSLMMEGFLKQLVSQSQYSKNLRQVFLFKIIPMINPDGVVNGNYRFSAAGYDLNRKWRSCTSKMHPEVYFLKERIKQISKSKYIIMFIDLHGHSRQKNAFFYGCCPKGYLQGNDTENTKPKQFPFLMSKIHSVFRYDYCSYAMQKQKEGTARITLWNQLKIDYIYTLQASFCGAEGASNFLIADYQKIGAKLCQGICLHFWGIIQEKISKTSSIALKNKMNDQIKKNMNEFFQNPQLAKVEFEGNSSDSEPQAGEIPQNQRKKQKSVISIQKYYKASRIMKFVDKNQSQEQNNALLRSKVAAQSKVDSNLRNKTNQSVRFVRGNDNQSGIFPQFKSQIKNLSTEIPQKSQNQFFVRAEFLNRTINERLKFEVPEKVDTDTDNRGSFSVQPFAIKNQNNQLHPINRNEHEKNKKKAISFEGAQYRRVRKLAEEHNKRHFSAQHSTQPKEDETLIRGLVGMNNLIQIQRGLETRSRQRAPSFFPNSTHYHKNSRKASMQMHFRRQIKATDYTSRRLYVNGLDQEVKCLGKQIL